MFVHLLIFRAALSKHVLVMSAYSCHSLVSFIATLQELNDIDDSSTLLDLMPTIIKATLDEFHDVMPHELPKKLPSRRYLDHQIKLFMDVRTKNRVILSLINKH